jgi:hypothetical protein
MGQLVAVSEKPSSSQPSVVRFELNRALTGMGHEHFTSAADAVGPRPAAELARRLFGTGQVRAVHVFSNIVTVELDRGGVAAPLTDILRTLYRYWEPGMAPPSFDDLQAVEEEKTVTAQPSGGDAGADAALSAAAQRVPAHLLERSRAGRERWKAKSGG